MQAETQKHGTEELENLRKIRVSVILVFVFSSSLIQGEGKNRETFKIPNFALLLTRTPY